MNRHDYKQAQQAIRRRRNWSRRTSRVLNSLGYAAGQAGDLDAAMTALRRYAALRPNEANPLDSMGDVNLVRRTGLPMPRTFYLSPLKKEPKFQNNNGLMKAALARLLSGDVVAGANNMAERYLAARAEAKDTIVDYRRAQWSWISGRRKAAAQQMGAFALAAECGPAARYCFARLCRARPVERDVRRSRRRRCVWRRRRFRSPDPRPPATPWWPGSWRSRPPVPRNGRSAPNSNSPDRRRARSRTLHWPTRC